MIGFNPKFLIDALRVIDDEEVDLYMVNPKAPCFIKNAEESYIYQMCIRDRAMTVTIPDAMVENQLDGLINGLRGHLQAQGVSLEQYLEAGGTTMEQLRDHARQQATAAARYELAMTEIARREGIDITEADLAAKYQELSRQYDLSVELLRQQLPPLRLRHDLRLAAAQAVVVDSAKRK